MLVGIRISHTGKRKTTGIKISIGRGKAEERRLEIELPFFCFLYYNEINKAELRGGIS